MTETARLADYVLPAPVAVREVGGDVLQLRVPPQRLPPAAPAARPAARHAARARDPRPALRGARARSTTTTSPRCGPRPRRAGPPSPTPSSPPSAPSRELGPARAGRALPDARPDAARRRRRGRRPVGRGPPLRPGEPGLGGRGRLHRRGPGARRARCSTPSSPARPGSCSPSTSPRSASAGSGPTTARSTWRSPSCSPSSTACATEAARPDRPSSRSCCRPASAGPSPPTRSSATRPGASATPTARCGSARPTPRRSACADGGRVRVTTKRGSGRGAVEVSDMHAAGPHLAAQRPRPRLPRRATATVVVTGVAPNELTASEDRDPIAGTPWHKHVPARLELVT